MYSFDQPLDGSTLGPHAECPTGRHRLAFRAHALDDAMLYFQPHSGLSVRVDCPGTINVRRRAPRVVLFSLSHACNLRCSFCLRDSAIQSRWDADEAFELLSSLADAGTLEVAFGGGEPLAYTGFTDSCSA